SRTSAAAGRGGRKVRGAVMTVVANTSIEAVTLAEPTWPGLDIDSRIPALLLKVGQYPIHSGGLGVIRTLGRLGIPVYAITEPGLTPAVASRYCTEAFVWRATGAEE